MLSQIALSRLDPKVDLLTGLIHLLLCPGGEAWTNSSCGVRAEVKCVSPLFFPPLCQSKAFRNRDGLNQIDPELWRAAAGTQTALPLVTPF